MFDFVGTQSIHIHSFIRPRKASFHRGVRGIHRKLQPSHLDICVNNVMYTLYINELQRCCNP